MNKELGRYTYKSIIMALKKEIAAEVMKPLGPLCFIAQKEGYLDLTSCNKDHAFKWIGNGMKEEEGVALCYRNDILEFPFRCSKQEIKGGPIIHSKVEETIDHSNITCFIEIDNEDIIPISCDEQHTWEFPNRHKKENEVLCITTTEKGEKTFLPCRDVNSINGVDV